MSYWIIEVWRHMYDFQMCLYDAVECNKISCLDPCLDPIKFVVCHKNTNSLIPMDVWLLLWLTSGDLGIMKPSEFILWPDERHTNSLCIIQTNVLIGRICSHKIFKCTRRKKFFIVELRIRLLARNKYVTFHAHRYIITKVRVVWDTQNALLLNGLILNNG